MGLKIRHHKNKKGKEIFSASIPYSEVIDININSRRKDEERLEYELKGFLKKVYGEGDYSRVNNLIGFSGKDYESKDLKKGKLGEFYVSPNKGGDLETKHVSIKLRGGNLIFKPATAIHDITGYGYNKENKLTKKFEDVINILEEGFTSDSNDDNAFIKRDKSHWFNHEGDDNVTGGKIIPETYGITQGDVFSLELLPKEYKSSGEITWGRIKGMLKMIKMQKSPPENIYAVNIHLSDRSSEEKKQEKMKFYKEKIKPYGTGVRFFVWDEPKKEFIRTSPKRQSLEKKLIGIISISGFVLSLFFLSSNITGNVVGNLTLRSSSFIGGGLFILGLVTGFFWLKKSFNKK